MNWLLTALLCVVLVEFGLRLPFSTSLTGIGRSGPRAMRIIRSPAISDHWKEKAMGAYARTTFISSMKLAGLLVVFFGLAWILTLGFDLIAPGYQSFLLSWGGLGLSAVLATLYFIARKSLIRVFL